MSSYAQFGESFQSALKFCSFFGLQLVLTSISVVQHVYHDWRSRTHIKHFYHLYYEQGLNSEDTRVKTVESMCRLFAIVLLAA